MDNLTRKRENGLKNYGVGCYRRLTKMFPVTLFTILLLVTDALLIQREISIEGWLSGSFWQGSFATLLLVSLIPALIPYQRLRQAVIGIEGIFLSLLFVYEYHLLTEWDTLISNSVMLHYESIAKSQEINPGFLFSGISLRSWLLGSLYPIGYALLLILARFLYCHRSRLRTQIQTLKSWRWVLLIPALPFFVLHLTLQYPFYYEPEITPYNQLSMVERFWVGTGRAIRERGSIEELVATFRSIPLETETTTEARPLHNVVVIMGESLRRQDMHCYGYPLENTPRIDDWVTSGQMILYDDVVSCAPNTNLSIQSILTYHTKDKPNKDWIHYPTLPLAFSDAGYFSYWNSNQEKSGGWVENITPVAATSDSIFYTVVRSSFLWRWGETENTYDERVLPYLLSYEEMGRNVFEVVHLMGSHPHFRDRYPDSFQRFSADDIREPLNNRQKRISAEYMNSIYYNDSVVGAIVERYAEQSSLIVYLSDHGITRYDDPTSPDLCAHNNDPSALQIPFMVYMSRKFEADNPDIAEKVRLAAHKPFMTDLFTHSLVGLMGIKNRYTRPEWELWSSLYNDRRKRIIKAWDRSTIIPFKYLEGAPQK